MMNILHVLGKLAGLLAQLKDMLRGDSGSYEAELLKRKGKLAPVPVPVKNNREFFGR